MIITVTFMTTAPMMMMMLVFRLTVLQSICYAMHRLPIHLTFDGDTDNDDTDDDDTDNDDPYDQSY